MSAAGAGKPLDRYLVKVAEVPVVPTLVIRTVARGPELASVVPAGCGAAWALLRTERLRGGHNIALYLAGGVVEAGVEFEGSINLTGAVVRSTLPGGRAATTMHRGPYAELGLAHQAVQDWCRRAGHELAGPSWERYGHWQDSWNSDPSKVETEVCWLLK